MKIFTKEEKQVRIAKNVAKLIDEDPKYTVVNLGVGIPTMVVDYLERKDVYVMAENGMLGVGPIVTGEDVEDNDLVNAGRQNVKETPGCMYFSSEYAFGLIRGGHIDATVLGAFEVDAQANVANWIVPGGKQLGVGGAMDLASGAKEVIIAMTHTSKTSTKLVKKCTLPMTAKSVVDHVVTEYAVFSFIGGKLLLEKIAPEITIEELQEITDIPFEAAENLRAMTV